MHFLSDLIYYPNKCQVLKNQIAKNSKELNSSYSKQNKQQHIFYIEKLPKTKKKTLYQKKN